MKEWVGGLMLLCAIVPLAVIGYLLIVLFGSFGRTQRVRAGVRALDHFVNATVFNGYAWESVSSHAWREREKWWAKAIIWVTDHFQQNHCMRSNKREQPVINLILEKRLHEQTIR